MGPAWLRGVFPPIATAFAADGTLRPSPPGFLEYLRDAKPAVVILELGGNDGLRGTPLSATRANLEQIVVDLRKSGARIVLHLLKTLKRNSAKRGIACICIGGGLGGAMMVEAL